MRRHLCSFVIYMGGFCFDVFGRLRAFDSILRKVPWIICNKCTCAIFQPEKRTLYILTTLQIRYGLTYANGANCMLGSPFPMVRKKRLPFLINSKRPIVLVSRLYNLCRADSSSAFRDFNLTLAWTDNNQDVACCRNFFNSRPFVPPPYVFLTDWRDCIPASNQHTLQKAERNSSLGTTHVGYAKI